MWREGREKRGRERPSAFIAAAPPVSSRHTLPRMRILQIAGSYGTGVRPSFVLRFLPFRSPSSLDTFIPLSLSLFCRVHRLSPFAPPFLPVRQPRHTSTPPSATKTRLDLFDPPTSLIPLRVPTNPTPCLVQLQRPRHPRDPSPAPRDRCPNPRARRPHPP